jgi:23S rRNA (cytosine1962-C5)-methyltransferase
MVMLLKGPPIDELVVTENGLRFITTPGTGPGIGLFLDHRANRKRIRSLAGGKRVLNLFAYTSGFSVAAAAGGAASTVSVDLSATNLEWGQRNFAANGIDRKNHAFIRGDASDYLNRARRQGCLFDIIILDPPTFSRTRKPKRSFEIKKNLAGLIAESASILSPRGHMLVATNSRKLSIPWLIEQVGRGAGGRPFETVAKPRLPADFAPDPDHQKTILVRFG